MIADLGTTQYLIATHNLICDYYHDYLEYQTGSGKVLPSYGKNTLLLQYIINIMSDERMRLLTIRDDIMMVICLYVFCKKISYIRWFKQKGRKYLVQHLSSWSVNLSLPCNINLEVMENLLALKSWGTIYFPVEIFA